MKTSLFLVTIALAFEPVVLAAGNELKDQKDRLSYSVGIEIGKTLKNRSFDIDEDVLEAGLQDGLGGLKPRLTGSEMKAAMAKAEKEIGDKLVAAKKAAGEKNALEGPKFLAENKVRDGVETTASGLQYKVLHEGSGPIPKETDTVTIAFSGKTIDGKEFDSSYRTGRPEELPINRMIKGWREGLQLMKVGSKFQFFVPADLAYGKNGGGPIGPNAALVFEIELINIVQPRKPATVIVPETKTPPKER